MCCTLHWFDESNCVVAWGLGNHTLCREYRKLSLAQNTVIEEGGCWCRRGTCNCWSVCGYEIISGCTACFLLITVCCCPFTFLCHWASLCCLWTGTLWIFTHLNISVIYALSSWLFVLLNFFKNIQAFMLLLRALRKCSFLPLRGVGTGCRITICLCRNGVTFNTKTACSQCTVVKGISSRMESLSGYL
jgi:hypothetical protein